MKSMWWILYKNEYRPERREQWNVEWQDSWQHRGPENSSSSWRPEQWRSSYFEDQRPPHRSYYHSNPTLYETPTYREGRYRTRVDKWNITKFDRTE